MAKEVRAIHANAGVQAWYRAQLEAWIKAMALSMEFYIESTWVEYTPVLAQDAANSSTKMEKTLKRWGDKWISRFDRMSRTLATTFADKALSHTDASFRAALANAGFTIGKFRPTPAMKEAYRAVIAENVNLIRSIPQQYLTGVQSRVWESVMRGGDMASLSRSLQQEYGSTVKRAALIARDQNNKAKATFEQARRIELGMVQARWLHSAGGKVPRPTHVAMSGKLFDIRKGMWDEDEGEWVQPGQLINCRCVSTAVIPGLEHKT